MSAVRNTQGAEEADFGRSVPTPQGLVLFEHYEASGSLLLVTSDATSIVFEPGDYVIRRPWATASQEVTNV